MFYITSIVIIIEIYFFKPSVSTTININSALIKINQ